MIDLQDPSNPLLFLMSFTKNSQGDTLNPLSIACVTVLFHPPPSVVEIMNAFCRAGHSVYAVINAVSPEIMALLNQIHGITLVQNGKNIGLASALNEGLCLAFADDATSFVCLFDQDSRPEATLPMNLAHTLIKRLPAVAACIGPQLCDEKAPALVLGNPNLDQVSPARWSIPTSGSLIPRAAYFAVGPMRGDFFIDAIDHEWCFRAKAMGFPTLLCPKFQMVHNMGDGALNWFGRFKPIHRSPIRHYYILRNHAYLVIHGPAPWGWRLIETLKILRRCVLYPFVSSRPMMSAICVLLGIYDGVTGKLGEFRYPVVNPSTTQP